jgi:hypothetical protein
MEIDMYKWIKWATRIPQKPESNIDAPEEYSCFVTLVVPIMLIMLKSAHTSYVGDNSWTRRGKDLPNVEVFRSKNTKWYKQDSLYRLSLYMIQGDDP